MNSAPRNLSWQKKIIVACMVLLWLGFNVVLCLHGTANAAYSLVANGLVFAIIRHCPTDEE